jgi:hypothetical protein
MSGFGVDPDVLAAHAEARGQAADRVAARSAPPAAPEGSFGVIGEVFAVGVRAAAASGVEAIEQVGVQFRVTAWELAAAARSYRAADASAASDLAGSWYLSDTFVAQVPRNGG